MFRFADVPLSLSGMTRITGKRVFLRAASLDDWSEWAELRARSRAFLSPWGPSVPEGPPARFQHYGRGRRGFHRQHSRHHQQHPRTKPPGQYHPLPTRRQPCFFQAEAGR